MLNPFLLHFWTCGFGKAKLAVPCTPFVAKNPTFLSMSALVVHDCQTMIRKVSVWRIIWGNGPLIKPTIHSRAAILSTEEWGTSVWIFHLSDEHSLSLTTSYERRRKCGSNWVKKPGCWPLARRSKRSKTRVVTHLILTECKTESLRAVSRWI